mmetsp:Transcript_76189/g.235245  ORF Transcript_76189/g.235245 Transcript_76189/m.235245 type:complete len:239 (-) Transcript_76189:109-825(-)
MLLPAWPDRPGCSSRRCSSRCWAASRSTPWGPECVAGSPPRRGRCPACRGPTRAAWPAGGRAAARGSRRGLGAWPAGAPPAEWRELAAAGVTPGRPAVAGAGAAAVAAAAAAPAAAGPAAVLGSGGLSGVPGRGPRARPARALGRPAHATWPGWETNRKPWSAGGRRRAWHAGRSGSCARSAGRPLPPPPRAVEPAWIASGGCAQKAPQGCGARGTCSEGKEPHSRKRPRPPRQGATR